ncbi:MAG: RagB/SusD family nutrient uptake outer membrane protein, partial [Sphingobacterium sp.]
SIHLFNGISNNELYLIRAECAARLEDFRNARSDINKLLKNRYLVDTFDGIEVEDSDLLAFILEERRKELVGRDIRWGDLKRLNLEPKFAKTLVREINGQKFTLPPNDPRYAFPFPSSENNDKMKR